MTENSCFGAKKGRVGRINFNLYHYAGNSPVKYTDPDGRKELDALDPKRRFKEIQGKSSPLYNCHSYAFNNSAGWLNDPTQIIKKDYDKIATEEKSKKGDRLIYYIDENGNKEWDSGEYIKHSAVVEKVDEDGNVLTIKEKRGKLPEYESSPYESLYQDTPYVKRQYLRQKTQSESNTIQKSQENSCEK